MKDANHKTLECDQQANAGVHYELTSVSYNHYHVVVIAVAIVIVHVVDVDVDVEYGYHPNTHAVADLVQEDRYP